LAACKLVCSDIEEEDDDEVIVADRLQVLDVENINPVQDDEAYPVDRVWRFAP
jgi:hypothetical protein